MTVNQIPVVMAACVVMALTLSLVHVCLASVGGAVSRTSMSVKVTLVKTEQIVLTVSTAILAHVPLASVALIVRSILMTVLTALALMEAPVWMVSMLSPAYAYLDLREVTASMTSMSVILSLA